MTTSINGTTGITYPNSSTQDSIELPAPTDVGAIIFAKAIASGSQAGTIAFGQNRAGTNLWFSDSVGSNGPNVGVGTWKCLGYITNLDRTSAWVRVS